MTVVQAVFAIIGTTVAVAGTLAGVLRWVYKRGLTAGAEQERRDAARAADQAKFRELQQQLTDTRAELASTRDQLSADLAKFDDLQRQLDGTRTELARTCDQLAALQSTRLGN